MNPEGGVEGLAARTRALAGTDVEGLLRKNGWLPGERTPDTEAWMERAAELLGSHCESREKLGELLALVFRYDARALLAERETHMVLTRKGARAVLRELADVVLAGGPVDSDRLKEVFSELKARLPFRGRELVHTLRLVLAGRVGEGELDRVILLLDTAAQLSFSVRVKSCRERVLEFCAEMQ